MAELKDKSLLDKLTSGTGHKLEQVAKLTDYETHIREIGKLERAFQIAATWTPNIRYVASCGSREQAAKFLAAVRVLREDIRAWIT